MFVGCDVQVVMDVSEGARGWALIMEPFSAACPVLNCLEYFIAAVSRLLSIAHETRALYSNPLCCNGPFRIYNFKYSILAVKFVGSHALYVIPF